MVKHYNYRKNHKKRKTRNLKFAPLPSDRSNSMFNNLIPHTNSPQMHKIAEPMKGHNWRNNTTQKQTLNGDVRLLNEEQRYV